MRVSSPSCWRCSSSSPSTLSPRSADCERASAKVSTAAAAWARAASPSQRLLLTAVCCCAVLCAAVCLRRVGEMSASLSDLRTASSIEDGIRRLCRSYTDKADQRFCYYIGGTDDAATSLLRTVSGAMMNHLPAVNICDKLKKADGQICAVKYDAPPKPIDWSAVDLNKMRVKELKQILDRWGEKCDGCTEKGDFISLIDQVKAKHIGAEAAAASAGAGKGDL